MGPDPYMRCASVPRCWYRWFPSSAAGVVTVWRLCGAAAAAVVRRAAAVSGRQSGQTETATTPAIQFISYTNIRITAGDGSEGAGCGLPV